MHTHTKTHIDAPTHKPLNNLQKTERFPLESLSVTSPNRTKNTSAMLKTTVRYGTISPNLSVLMYFTEVLL